MSLKQKAEYDSIIKDIIKNEKFLRIDSEIHHGISRLSHSERVAKMAYTISKKLKLDYVKTTRAALLHDFYTNEDVGSDVNSAKRMCKHPEVAAKNAKENFEITSLEENIIKSHMFPLTPTQFPKYKESVIVGLADKTVATYELYKFKFNTLVNVSLLFIFNMITIQK